MKIRLTESQLRNIIAKTLNESMDEWQSVMRFPQGFVSKKGEDWKRERINKEAEKNPNLDPAGYQWFGDELRHNEKPRPKSAPKPKRQIISKPEGMSDEEYEQKLVIPNNPKFREKLEQYDDEEFRPIVNGGRYFGGAADYGCDYEVSNRGRLKVLNHSDAIKSNIYDPYPAPTRKAMQFHLNAMDDEGNKMFTCPNVAYMVANAFLGEHDPSQYTIRHKDGDWRNNNAENLEWVPAKVTGRFGKVSESKR
jgi:hypothetical protein